MSTITITKNYEADNRTGLNHEGRQPNSPVERLTATSIIGDPVENHSGEHLGKIDNVIVNTQSSKIEYAVVDFSYSIESNGKLYAVPFAALTLDATRKIFVIECSRDKLKVAPGFDRSNLPDPDDVYFTEVNMFYARIMTERI